MDGLQPDDIPTQFSIQYLSPTGLTNTDDNTEFFWTVVVPQTIEPQENNFDKVIGPEELNCGCVVPTRLQESCGIAEYNGSKIIVYHDGGGGRPKPTAQKSKFTGLKLGKSELTSSVRNPSNGFRNVNKTVSGLLTTDTTNSSSCLSGECSFSELSYSICRSKYSLDSMDITVNDPGRFNIDPSILINDMGVDDPRFKKRSVLEPNTLESSHVPLSEDQTTLEILKKFRANKKASRTLEKFIPLGEKGPVFVLKKGWLHILSLTIIHFTFMIIKLDKTLW